jgi:predicted phosphodiesterase
MLNLKPKIGFSIFVLVFVVSICSSLVFSEEVTYRFGVLGDRTGSHQPGIFPQAVKGVNLLNPDIVLSVGDYIEGYTTDTTALNKEWDEFLEIMGKLKAPYYLVPGNHDITFDEAEPVYRKRVGDPYYSFDFKNTHFIMLDVSRIEKAEDLPQEQMDWLKEDLKKHQGKENVFVFFHKPLWFVSIEDKKVDPMHEVFKEYGVDAVFSGHYHHYFTGDIDGIRYICVGSSGGAMGMESTDLGFFYHYLWCTVKGNKLDVALIKLGSVLQRDLVNLEEEMVISSFYYDKLIRSTPVFIREGAKGYSGQASVLIKSSKTKPLIDTLTWTFEDNWEVTPKEQAIRISPSSDWNKSFQVIMKGDLYPLPSYSVGYDFGRDKTYPFEGTLNLKRELNCRKFEKSPKIDGIIDEEEWKDASFVEQFGSPDGKRTVVEPTKFYWGYDKKNLFIAASCAESKTDSLKAEAKAQDGAVYLDDCVGFFFCPDSTARTTYQIYFNSKGIAFDQILKWQGDEYEGEDREWNGEYKVATKVNDEDWSIEMRIPFKLLKTKPKKGDFWLTNFRRKQQRVNSASDWMVPISYDPRYYGILRFD